MSAEAFLAKLEGLIEDNIINDLRRQLAQSKTNVTARSIAKLLVDKGKITSFQAKKLLADDDGGSKSKPPPPPGKSKSKKKQPPSDDLALADDDESADDEIVELSAAASPPQPAAQPGRTKQSSAQPPAGGKASGGLKPISGPGLTPLTSDDVIDAPGGLQPLTEDDVMSAGDALQPLDGLSAADPFSAAPAGGAPDAGGRTQHTGRFKSKKVRANQWDSPWLLIGGGGLLLSLILVGVLWFMLSRDNAEEMFAAAEEAYNSESYSDAIKKYDVYLEKFDDDDNAPKARVRRAMARLRLPIISQDWDNALETAQEELPAIEEDLAEYTDARSELATLLPDIAEGFSIKARAAINNPELARDLVESTDSAMKLVSNPIYLPTTIRKNPAVESRINGITDKLADVKDRLGEEEALLATVDEIEAALEESRTTDAYALREKLLDSHPSLIIDARLAEAVKEITRAERNLVVATDSSLPLESKDHTRMVVSSTVVANTSGSPIDSIVGSHIFILARNAVYGLDAGTGRVLWRRFVGNTDIHPQPISALVGADVIAADGDHDELIRLSAADGSLVWRLPIGERFATPLIAEERIFITTASGKLIAVEADGKVTRTTQIPQPLIAGPGFTRQQYLYQPGQHSNLYVLKSGTLDCQEVFYLGHKSGSVAVPPVMALGYLFVLENINDKQSLLHVLETSRGTKLTRPETMKNGLPLDGRVIVPPQLYGSDRVLVTTDLGAAYLYEVDPSGGAPVKEIAKSAARFTEPTLAYPLAHDGRLWMGANRFSVHEIQIANLSITAPSTVVGREGDAFVAPLQRVGDTIVHVRLRSGALGVSVSAVTPDAGKEIWRTDLAVPFAGPPHVDEMSKRLIPVTAQARVLLLDANSLNQASVGYPPDPALYEGANNSALALTYGAALGGSKLAYTESTGSKQVLGYDPNDTFDPLRLSEMKIGDSTQSGPPIAFSGGLLVPASSGRVHLLDPINGREIMEPFFPPLKPGTTVQWQRPVAVADGKEFLIADSRHKIYRVGVQSGGVKPQLVKLSEVELSGDIVSALGVVGQTVYAVVRAQRSDTVVALGLADLKQVKDELLDGRIDRDWGLQQAGDMVFVATETEGLLGFDAEAKLRWRSPLGRGPLAGQPLAVGDGFVFASRSGYVWRADGASGDASGEILVGELLQHGPLLFNDAIVVCGNDGVLHVVPMIQSP